MKLKINPNQPNKFPQIAAYDDEISYHLVVSQSITKQNFSKQLFFLSKL